MMMRVVVALMIAVLPACKSELSTDELMAGLKNAGIKVDEARKERSAMQQEFDNINDALSTGIPIPKLVKTVRLDGVATEIYWCPGKAQQAELVVARLSRGPLPDDPPYLDVAAQHISGWLNLTMESHIISMSPPLPRAPRDDPFGDFPDEKPEKPLDAAVLKIALALARMEDR